MSFRELFNDIVKKIKAFEIETKSKEALDFTVNFFKKHTHQASLNVNKFKQDLICRKNKSRFSDYIDGFLNSKQKIDFESHISKCTDCANELKIYKKMLKTLKNNKKVELPEDFSALLHDRLIEANNSSADKTDNKITDLIDFAKNFDYKAWLDSIWEAKSVLLNPKVYVPALSAIVLATVFASGVYDRAKISQRAYVNETDLNKVSQEQFSTYDTGDNLNIKETDSISAENPERQNPQTTESEKTSETSENPSEAPNSDASDNNTNDTNTSTAVEPPQTTEFGAAQDNSAESRLGTSDDVAQDAQKENMKVAPRMAFTLPEGEIAETQAPGDTYFGGGGGSVSGSAPAAMPAPMSADTESQTVSVYRIVTSNVSGVISKFSALGKAVHSEGNMQVLILTMDEYDKVLDNLDYNEITVSYSGIRSVTKSYEKNGYCRIEIMSK